MERGEGQYEIRMLKYEFGLKISILEKWEEVGGKIGIWGEGLAKTLGIRVPKIVSPDRSMKKNSVYRYDFGIVQGDTCQYFDSRLAFETYNEMRTLFLVHRQASSLLTFCSSSP